jgi:hypothetical protein
MAKIYHLAVRYLGTRDVGKNDPKSNIKAVRNIRFPAGMTGLRINLTK